MVAEAAGRAGASCARASTVTGVRLDDTGRVAGVYGHDRGGDPVEIDARFVVGADGLARGWPGRSGPSVVEDRGRPAAPRSTPTTPACRGRGIEFFVADGALAGVFPTHDGEACIWVVHPVGDAVLPDGAAGLPRRGVHRAAGAGRAGTWPRGCDAARATSPVERHAPGAQPAPPGVRPGLGAGRRRRLPPRPGHRPRHQRRLPGRRAAGRARCDRALRGEADEAAALAGYQRRRDEALREIFDLTCALVAYPPVPEFVELQRRLSGPSTSRRPRWPPDRCRATASPARAPAPAITNHRTPTHTRRTDMTTHRANESRPQRRRHRHPVRHARRGEGGARGGQVPVPGQQRVAQRHPQPQHHRRLLRRRRGARPRAHASTSTPTTRRCWSGSDNGPTPVEYVLHALAACLTAGLANIAAARGVPLTEVRSTVAGDIDLNGILGLEPRRPQRLPEASRVRFTVKGDAPAEKLREIVEQSRARSAVYDVITNQVPVTIEVDASS